MLHHSNKPLTPAGEWGSEGVSNRCCPGCPAAVCSTAGGEMSSHLEEIRMENIRVKNKRIKIAIQKKKKEREKLCLLRNMYKPCPELMLLKVHGIYTRSRMPTLGAPHSWQGHPIGLHPTVSAVTPPTCCSCFILTAERGLLSLYAVPGLWKCFLCHSSTSPAASGSKV